LNRKYDKNRKTEAKGRFYRSKAHEALTRSLEVDEAAGGPKATRLHCELPEDLEAGQRKAKRSYP
jgi:hypothetical protein